MKIFLYAGAFFFLAHALPMAAVELNVQQFGAKGDGKTLDTTAIQTAVDNCSEKGGGTVIIPSGHYVSGTILLKDNVTLRLERGAELLGSLNILDYAAPDKFRSGNGAEMGDCFIGAVGTKNIGVIGEGVIDGRGAELLTKRPPGSKARPFLMRFVRCEGVSLSGVRLQGPAAWTAHFFQCKHVAAEHITIMSRGLPNNDGFDIDSSEDVKIRNCTVDSGDDSVCLKTTSRAACRNIEISGCDLKSHWGGVKFGTESAGDFEDVKVRDCRIHDAQGGIKLFSVDGAQVRDVSFSGVTMENVNTPVFIRLGARLKTFREGDTPQSVGSVSNVVIRDLKAQAISNIGILISGIPNHGISAVRLENIQIKLPGGGAPVEANLVLPEKENAYPEITMFGKQFPAYGLYARHVAGLIATNVTIQLAAPDSRPPFVSEDAKDFHIVNWKLTGPSGVTF